MAAGQLSDEFADDGVMVSPTASSPDLGTGLLQAEEKERLERRRSLASRSSLITRLASGFEEVVSEEGTSQYALGGLSSCGIAALNATRLVLCHEKDLPPVRGRGIQLLKDVATAEALHEITRATACWTHPDHLEVDEIKNMPLFATSLEHIGIENQDTSITGFTTLLQRLQSHSEHPPAGQPTASTASVITRSPEIISTFYIPIALPDLQGAFVIFDSHPRPSKGIPGASFIIFPSIVAAATYLSDLFHMDPNVLLDLSHGDSAMLTQYTAELFIAHPDFTKDIEETGIYTANFEAYRLKSLVSTLQESLRLSNSKLSSLESLRSKLSEQEEMTRNLYERIERSDAELISLKVEKANIQATSALQSETIHDFQDTLQALTSEKHHLELLSQSTSSELVELKRTLSTLRSEHDRALSQALSERDSINRNRGEEFDRVTSQLRRVAEQERTRHQRELEILREILTVATTDSHRARQSAASMRQEADQLKEELESEREKRMQAEADLAVARQQAKQQAEPDPLRALADAAADSASVSGTSIYPTLTKLGKRPETSPSSSNVDLARSSSTPSRKYTDHASQSASVKLAAAESLISALRKEKESVRLELQAQIADSELSLQQLASSKSLQKSRWDAREAEYNRVMQQLWTERQEWTKKGKEMSEQVDALEYQVRTLKDAHSSEMQSLSTAHNRQRTEMHQQLQSALDTIARLTEERQRGAGAGGVSGRNSMAMGTEWGQPMAMADLNMGMNMPQPQPMQFMNLSPRSPAQPHPQARDDPLRLGRANSIGSSPGTPSSVSAESSIYDIASGSGSGSENGTARNMNINNDITPTPTPRPQAQAQAVHVRVPAPAPAVDIPADDNNRDRGFGGVGDGRVVVQAPRFRRAIRSFNRLRRGGTTTNVDVDLLDEGLQMEAAGRISPFHVHHDIPRNQVEDPARVPGNLYEPRYPLINPIADAHAYPPQFPHATITEVHIEPAAPVNANVRAPEPQPQARLHQDEGDQASLDLIRMLQEEEQRDIDSRNMAMQLQQELDNHPPEPAIIPEDNLRARDVFDRVDYDRGQHIDDHDLYVNHDRDRDAQGAPNANQNANHTIDDDEEFARRLQELELQGAEVESNAGQSQDMNVDMPGVWREPDHHDRAGRNEPTNLILIGLQYRLPHDNPQQGAGLGRTGSIRAAARPQIREVPANANAVAGPAARRPEPQAQGEYITPEALQAQFDLEDLAIRSDHDHAIREYSQATFECSVCLETHPEDDLAVVEGCGHKFCRFGTKDYVISKIGEGRYPIQCPVCQSSNTPDAAPGFLNRTLIEQLGLTEEQYNQWIKLELAEHSVSIDCRRCNRSSTVDRADYTDEKYLRCPHDDCDNFWCKECQQSVTVDPMGEVVHSCDGTAELAGLMEQQGWKACPGCRTPIERTYGCNHMTCPTPGCNTHFCYVCGDSIVRSVVKATVDRELERHYSTVCDLFEAPPEQPRGPPPPPLGRRRTFLRRY